MLKSDPGRGFRGLSHVKHNEVDSTRCQEETGKWGLLESAGFSSLPVSPTEKEIASEGGLQLATRRSAGRSEKRKEETEGRKERRRRKVRRRGDVGLRLGQWACVATAAAGMGSGSVVA